MPGEYRTHWGLYASVASLMASLVAFAVGSSSLDGGVLVLGMYLVIASAIFLIYAVLAEEYPCVAWVIEGRVREWVWRRRRR